MHQHGVDNSANAILKGLNPQQLEAVNYNAGPCLVVAGAGTGKTRVITSKIAKLIHDGMPAGRILALTFTNKAANEMKTRIENFVPGQGVRCWIHTFHSLGARLLRQHAKRLNLNPDFLIYDEEDQKKVLKTIFDEMGAVEEKNKAGLYLNLISRAKDDLLDAESYAIHSQTSPSPYRLAVADVYLKYQTKLNQAGALDFGDLLLKTVELLREKTDVRDYYQDYFQYVLVDEYQDTNHSQYILTRMLAAKHKNLCVVGDPDQSIYSWRGANIRNILEFERDFPDAKILSLEQNYRSTANILKGADKLIAYNKQRKPKKLYTTKHYGDPIEVSELANEREEARWVARKCLELINDHGYGLNDIAVFYRTNAQSRSFEESFRMFNTPYRVYGSLRFYDRAEIKDAIAYSRILINSYDNVSIQRIINVPRRGMGKTAMDKITRYAGARGVSIYEALLSIKSIPDVTPSVVKSAHQFCLLIEDFRAMLNIEKPSEVIKKLLAVSGYWAAMEAEAEKDPQALNKLGNLQEYINAVKDYEERCAKTDTAPSLSGYLQEISLITGQDEVSSETGAVTLMTVHLAKGLEFDGVFLTGLEEGLFPITAGQKSDEEIEEERRLCYVGMTRAKKNLFMSYCSTRRVFGTMYSNLASRFLFEGGLLSGALNKEDGKEVEIIAPPSAMVPQSRIRIGQKVRHTVYGNGKVMSVSGSGDKAKATVLFDRGTRHTFMLMYAPLEVLN